MYRPSKTTTISIYSKQIKMMMVLWLASLACMQPTTQIEITPTLNIAPTKTAIPMSDEPASGTVFFIPTPTNAPRCAAVTALEWLHLREEPNENSRILSWLPAGKTVTVLNPSSLWWKIKADGVVGYAHSAYMERSKCQ